MSAGSCSRRRRSAWLAAYRNPAGDRVLAALDWTQRHLPHLESRVRELLGRCSGVRHEPARTAIPPVAGASLRAYAYWWAADRDPAREPEPVPAPPGDGDGRKSG